MAVVATCRRERPTVTATARDGDGEATPTAMPTAVLALLSYSEATVTRNNACGGGSTAMASVDRGGGVMAAPVAMAE